jgi:DNA polymerase III epsilon subunit-like protein
MSWPTQLIHVIDFEGSLGSGVVEYGVVSWQGGRIVSTATRRCAPTGLLRPEDVEVHGLSSEHLEGLACLAEDFAFFAGLRSTGPLAAHFANAENMLLKSVWPYPHQVPDFARGGGHTVIDWGPWIDTGRLYPQLYHNLASVRLEDLVRVFQLQAVLDEVAQQHCPTERCRYHSALYDALAAALLLDRLASEPAVARQSLPWLLEQSTLDPNRREALRQGTFL